MEFTEAQTELMESMSARMDAATAREECAHACFPEVTEDALLFHTIAGASMSVQIGAQSVTSVEQVIATLEHALILVAATAYAYGRISREDDGMPDWQSLTQEEWAALADRADWE